ncbi:MFS general substrate transporter [Aspergillus novofumigatus IBT 16806]|uniref:MFS general substrate transporter n=1 Tax=Aspergillus novofumigatus (strain IBT 16806) TaxID=1392255 RepID=A0A2I1CH35_ASPN1|nr:MFS general substrate transporter [Aspergillus novofumigatus IBT 16806]PKX96942.1 MFS general substrate transporter [Aspergillus novofumigatus IBT 16806]
MAGADTAEGEKSTARKESPALHITTQPDALSELHEEDKYLHGRALVLMTLSLMVGVFTVALDNSIIFTAISVITTDVDSLSDVTWNGSVYLLAQMSFQPTFGKAYTFFNLKWVWLGSGLLFEAGSVICAAAPNSPAFITGQAVAGLGAAELFCGALIIMAQMSRCKSARCCWAL